MKWTARHFRWAARLGTAGRTTWAAWLGAGMTSPSRDKIRATVAGQAECSGGPEATLRAFQCVTRPTWLTYRDWWAEIGKGRLLVHKRYRETLGSRLGLRGCAAPRRAGCSGRRGGAGPASAASRAAQWCARRVELEETAVARCDLVASGRACRWETGTISRQVCVLVLRMVTIGVYGFDGESFLQRLRHADVGRARRTPAPRCPRTRICMGELTPTAGGPRPGADRLRAPPIAPTTELRQLQYAEDDRQGSASAPPRALCRVHPPLHH